MNDLGISVIVFSKDRPFQLSEYLRTLQSYSQNVNLRISVLANIQPEFEEGYQLISEMYPDVDIVRETNFGVQLCSLLNNDSNDGYLIFGVDDALFCSDIPWKSATDALASVPQLQCVHIRLSPGLSFCHPANSVQV